MPGNPLVRFDEGRVGRTVKVSPSLLLYRFNAGAELSGSQSLSGDYRWETSPSLGPDQFRPLRTRPQDLAAAA